MCVQQLNFGGHGVRLQIIPSPMNRTRLNGLQPARTWAAVTGARPFSRLGRAGRPPYCFVVPCGCAPCDCVSAATLGLEVSDMSLDIILPFAICLSGTR